MSTERVLNKVSRDREEWARALSRELAEMDYNSGMGALERRVQETEQRVREGEQRVREGEQRVQAAEQRAQAAERRAAELERRLREAGLQ
jgi:chromosome segregation ATPase